MSKPKSNPSDSIKAFGLILLFAGVFTAIGVAGWLMDPLMLVVISVPSVIIGMIVWFWGRSVEVNEQIRDLLQQNSSGQNISAIIKQSAPGISDADQVK